MTSSELRQKFLDFFEKRGHKILPSASLIPNDPTLLLTIAGMVPFKPIFLNKIQPNFKRVVSVQKCVRVNDLGNVGHTARHHTFFEMLGNFSFGDYFKKEACLWGWEFLTQTIGFSPDRMWVSVHRKDQEAFEVWKNCVGVPPERIVFLGDEDNFWASGPIGPCGYCSEIYYDRGEVKGCGQSTCAPGCNCDRYLEVWNLVFMEFDRKADGTLEELPKKNIDTGMGLERLASVVQETDTDYETDLFFPIIQGLEKISGNDYLIPALKPPFRIIADHIRAIVFLITDGIYPSNEGRGYILRRLIRRAYRYGGKIGIHQPFLHELLFTVIDGMSNAYPELFMRKDIISKIVFQEESRFQGTLQSGEAFLSQLIEQTKKNKKQQLSGKDIFMLYDTYGFPSDVAEDILQEEGLQFDKTEFENQMEQQKNRARKARGEKDRLIRSQKEVEELFTGIYSRFVGYNQSMVNTDMVALSDGEDRISRAETGQKVIVALKESPFYPEKGGQEFDTGWIESEQGRVQVEKVYSEFLIEGTVVSGQIKENDRVWAKIDTQRRRLIEIHHTTTHLLHRALREILGSQVKQAGSWVGESGLRFDFTHFSALSEDEIDAVEEIVNQKIFEDLPVVISYSSLDEAQRAGVIALFEEKYQSLVRIVRVGDYTAELCGGTHLRRTSEAGLFKIITESSIGSGLRRVEAVAGSVAYKYLQDYFHLGRDIKKIFGSDHYQILPAINNLIENNKHYKEELQRTFQSHARQAILDALQVAGSNNPPIYLTHLFVENPPEIDYLKEMVDELRTRLSQGIVVLGIKKDEAISGVLAEINLPQPIDLNRLVREITKKIGGGGGGRPSLVQFGGIPFGSWEKFVEEIKKMTNQIS
ncbi:MAG: alanine--tRNA ligase [Atribacterota bacterium]|jgi:alanyl-tRNA synthetase|uniref:alanine--tRNA ligase n=1 Tax=Atribacter sp. TaxID=2847780 RepID=UPI00345E63F2|nr:alanine--tRNA ligase [Atribacterota bacterium]